MFPPPAVAKRFAAASITPCSVMAPIIRNKPSNNPTTSNTEESTLGADQTRVPAVAGLTEDEAKAKLKDNSLGYLIKELHDKLGVKNKL